MIDVPTYRNLGPDPEPLGLRGERLLMRVATEQTRPRRTMSGEAVCPLAQAFGHVEACTQVHCPYFRVPGTHHACAVEEWAPRARRDPSVARWFVARRAEIARGRAAW